MRTMAAVRSMADLHRPSLFDVCRKVLPVGSSVISHAYEPYAEDYEFMKETKVQYENNFRMEPECKFPCGKVESIMRKVLDENLSDKTYHPTGCAMLCKIMAQDIKDQVRDLDLKRYKIVCVINIGEKAAQGVQIGTRCLWDMHRDNFAQATYETQHLFATALTYAVHYE